jgi:ubiquinone/menaquinone biosynthesis C-methylase UbiE
MQHHLFFLTFEDKLNLAPLKKPLNRVLDIGCGTGVWTIDFGIITCGAQ